MMSLEIALRTTVLLMSTAGMARLLKSATAATRHLVWHLAIVGVLGMPLVAPLVPHFQVPHVLQGLGGQGWDNTIVSMLAPVGTVGTLTWFLIGWLASEWRVRRSAEAPAVWVTEAHAVAARLGMRDPAEVRQSAGETSPCVAGLFRSVVLLPPSAARWTQADRQAALVHELTHIHRADRRTQALAQLACVLHWFNPIAWYAASALAREREHACDAEVLRLGARPSAYATLLLQLARTTPAAWVPLTELSMARASAVEGRILSILGGRTPGPWHGTRWGVVSALALLTAVVLSAQPTHEPIGLEPDATHSVLPNLSLLGLPAPAPAIADACRRALGDRDPQVREQATLGLARMPGAGAIAPLLDALKDPDAHVRKKAAIGLIFRRDPRVVEPLLIAITDDDAQVREKVAIALGTSADPRAANALTLAANDPDSQVREKALAGLLLLGPRQ